MASEAADTLGLEADDENVTQATSASTMGLAMLAFAGIWNVGITSKMLPKNTNGKMLNSSGRYRIPSGPIDDVDDLLLDELD